MNIETDLLNARPHPYPLPRGEGESLTGLWQDWCISRSVSFYTKSKTAANANAATGFSSNIGMPSLSHRMGEGRGEGKLPTHCHR